MASCLFLLPIPLVSVLLQSPEIAVQDAFVRERNALVSTFGRSLQGSDVVIVSIDDESVRALGAYPPFPRQLYAQLCRSLEEAGADVVGFSMVFDGRSPLFRRGLQVPAPLGQFISENLNQEVLNTAEKDDAALIDAFKRTSNVVLASQVDLGLHDLDFDGKRRGIQFLTPDERLISALGGRNSCLGNSLIETDSDGVVRNASIGAAQLPLLSSTASAFALKVVEKRLKQVAVDEPAHIRLGEFEFPREFRINYAGPAGTFPNVPLWKALQWRKYYPLGQGESAPESAAVDNPFRHKIVLIAYQDLSPDDSSSGSTAGAGLSSGMRGYATAQGGGASPMSVVEIQANIIQNLLDRNIITKTNWWQCALIFLLMSLAMAGLFTMTARSLSWRLGAAAAFSSVWILFCFLVFAGYHFLLPTITPLLAVVLPCSIFALVHEKGIVEPARLKQTSLFHLVASGEVARKIDSAELQSLGLEGRVQSVTVMVVTLGSTAELLNGVDSQESLVQSANIWKTVSQSILAHGGIIDNCSNQTLVAFWGAPLCSPVSEQVASAAACAIALRAAGDGLNADLTIGIDSGPALCGVRQQTGGLTCAYSVIGDVVERARSLASMQGQQSKRTLVGVTVAELSNGSFASRQIEIGRPDGALTQAFELLAAEGQMPAVLEESTSLYRQAMTAIAEADYSQAEKLLTAVLNILPDDAATRQALERCKLAKVGTARTLSQAKETDSED